MIARKTDNTRLFFSHWNKHMLKIIHYMLYLFVRENTEIEQMNKYNLRNIKSGPGMIKVTVSSRSAEGEKQSEVAKGSRRNEKNSEKGGTYRKISYKQMKIKQYKI